MTKIIKIIKTIFFYITIALTSIFPLAAIIIIAESFGLVLQIIAGIAFGVYSLLIGYLWDKLHEFIFKEPLEFTGDYWGQY